MSDHRRIRIDPLLEIRVHQFAIRDGRPFDAAAKRLIVLGLEAIGSPMAAASAATRHTDQH